MCYDGGSREYPHRDSEAKTVESYRKSNRKKHQPGEIAHCSVPGESEREKHHSCCARKELKYSSEAQELQHPTRGLVLGSEQKVNDESTEEDENDREEETDT